MISVQDKQLLIATRDRYMRSHALYVRLYNNKANNKNHLMAAALQMQILSFMSADPRVIEHRELLCRYMYENEIQDMDFLVLRNAALGRTRLSSIARWYGDKYNNYSAVFANMENEMVLAGLAESRRTASIISVLQLITLQDLIKSEIKDSDKSCPMCTYRFDSRICPLCGYEMPMRKPSTSFMNVPAEKLPFNAAAEAMRAMNEMAEAQLRRPRSNPFETNVVSQSTIYDTPIQANDDWYVSPSLADLYEDDEE